MSPEDVRLILEKTTEEELKSLAGELANQFYNEHRIEVPESSTTDGGAGKLMADGGRFFAGSSGRVYLVSLAMINTSVATHHGLLGGSSILF